MLMDLAALLLYSLGGIIKLLTHVINNKALLGGGKKSAGGLQIVHS